MPRDCVPVGGRRRRRACHAAAVFLLVLTVDCSGRPGQQPARDPNIILILIDSLRSDHLGIYGYERATSPTIDRLGREGVVFQNAVSSSSWTRPALGSLFTSLHPHVHGATETSKTLPAEAITLAEKMHERQYVTVGIQTNPLVSGNRNFAQGFDSYREVFASNGRQVVKDFRAWLDRHKQQKFFAYIHFMDVHLPYDAPRENRSKFVRPYTGRLDPRRIRSQTQIYDLLPTLTAADRSHIIDLYDAGINQVDDYIDIMINALRSRRLLDDTILIITSDHGEELFDHGAFEHGHSMHREVLQIPLIIWNPRLSTRGVRVSQVVRLIDVLPTVLGFLGVTPPPGVMGRDLGPSIADPNLDWDLDAFSEGVLYGPGQSAIQKGPFKMVRIDPTKSRLQSRFFERLPARPGWTSDGGLVQFFDLKRDPAEQHPIAGHALEPTWSRMLTSSRSAGDAVRLTPVTEAMDKERLEQLRSLGYLR